MPGHPDIFIPADLRDRFPDLTAALQPRPFVGEVSVVSGALSPPAIAGLLDLAPLCWPRRSGFMLPDAEGETVETVRPDMKGRTDFAVPCFQTIEDAVSRIVWTYSITYPPLDRIILGQYGVGDHFSWHRDDMLPATACRETAVVIGLNDDYEGGLLELPEAGLSLKVGKGMGVAFPASALHRVTPVTSGTREVLLTFVLKEPTA